MAKRINEDKAVDIVHVNFSKAFDKGLHGRWVQKFITHGIEGEQVNWIQLWLSSGRQRARLEGRFSDCRPVNSSVLQGSKQGSLKFVLYINDKDNNVVGWISKLADATKVVCKMESEEDCPRLQQNVDQFGKWVKECWINFNLDKCSEAFCNI